MRLDISEVLREVGKNLPYDINEPPLVDEDVECTSPVTGRVTFNNTGGILLVQGAMSTSVALPCSRCGLYYEHGVQAKVDEQFELRHTSAGPRTLATVTIVEEDDNPVAGKLFDGNVFDLTEMLRQYIVLDEPTRPLPPLLKDGRCAHCKLSPEVVLERLQLPEEAEPILNAGLSSLGDLLKQNKPE